MKRGEQQTGNKEWVVRGTAAVVRGTAAASGYLVDKIRDGRCKPPHDCSYSNTSATNRRREKREKRERKKRERGEKKVERNKKCEVMREESGTRGRSPQDFLSFQKLNALL